ncbi:MAG: hypothetical protein HS108_04870 [Planctomycetes bacterium]|nr:hypothetical protein [Planctomycetota bacterium]
MLKEANIRELTKTGESEALEFKRTTGLCKEAAPTSNSTANSLQFDRSLPPIRVQTGPFRGSNQVHFQAAAEGWTWEWRL